MYARGLTQRTHIRDNAARLTARIAALVAVAWLLGTLAVQASFRRPPPTPPTTPGDFHVTALTSNGVTFAWDRSMPGSTGGNLVYEIFNDTTGLSLNFGDVTSATWTEVQPGGTYSFHIIAVGGNPLEASAPSPEVTVTIPGAPPLPTPVQPAAPVITQTSATSNTLTVSWSEATPADEINAYDVSVNGMQDGGSSSNVTTATAVDLWPAFSYKVTVTAYSLNGTTGALFTTSAATTVTTAGPTNTPPADAPTTPTDLNGDGDGGGEAIISWNPSTSVNEPQADIQYNIYIDGVLDSFDSTVGQTESIYIFPRGATEPSQVWVVAVDQFGNQSAPSNVLIIDDF